MAAGGYDIGASFSGSSSATSGISGATQSRGGGVWGGTAYGPGSVVQGNPPVVSPMVLIVALIGAAIVIVMLFGKKR